MIARALMTCACITGRPRRRATAAYVVRRWGRCSNQDRPTVYAGVQFDCDGLGGVTRMDRTTAAPGRHFPTPAPDVPDGVCVAGARRIPIVARLSGTSPRRRRRAHIRADRIAAGSCAAGTGIHPTRLVDGRCCANEPAHGGMVRCWANGRTESLRADRHVRAGTVSGTSTAR